MALPKGCWDKKCKHKYTFDMSVDDLVIGCKLLQIECDECVRGFTPQEAKDWGEHIKSLSKPTGSNFYDKYKQDA